MKLNKTLSRILDGLILLVFILFFSSAGFQDRNTSGWYQQWFPNLNGSTIQDITFLDSLTGFAVTNANSSLQAYILKTTNGGDNWNINYTYIPPYTNWKFIKIIFINVNTGLAFTDDVETFTTTNSGLNWNIINNGMYPEDASVLNKDTIFIVKSNGSNGGVYRSTNGGINWTRIWTNGTSGNPDKIYMYDKNIGFTCNVASISKFRKTTDGGFSWFDINLTDAFLDIKLEDSLIGWKGSNSIQKTTDGGLTWFLQTPPNVSSFIIRSISVINKDTVWLGGTSYISIGGNYYGVLIKTTNGGTNWGYQIPNLAIVSRRYKNVNFTNSNNGWAYVDQGGVNDGIHTKVGGNDTTVYTSINNTSIEITDYQLFQNYPNPFNTRTVVSCQLLVVSNLSIKVYDVQGREVQTLVEGKLNPGVYEYIFNGNSLSSGIYFYSMIIDGKVLDTKRMMMIK
ncbi:MAG: T9SS type A sorting domain-containing protein [Candidatus Kapaibacterium sp.]